MGNYLFIGFFLFAFFVGLIILFSFSKKSSFLNKEIINKYKNRIKYIKANSSEKEKIIDYDKLYHNFLKELGYNGSFGEILKNEPKEIYDLNKVWELHKLRNRLVHDFDEHAQTFLLKKSREYEIVLKKLIDSVS